MPATKEATKACLDLRSKKENETPPESKQPDGPITIETVNKFLAYECGYKKHKGKTWRDVMEDDWNYFMWVLTKAMNPHTKTWAVLSTFLTPEERKAAILHAKTRPVYNVKK